ncbi:MAG TPA: PIG-L deacetylase family protein [Acidimicrobiales bacterium]|jgi:LmbE family N-acetylglucosaminyl deacetylase|nr:PIG-L deacetylase family protein [Acidimicrobiales bacterium]
MRHEQETERILIVTAHPDDVDFGAAGSVATWTEQGIGVTYCIVTSGEAGGSDASITRDEMAAIRRSEQTAAAEVVGVSDVRFLGHPDGRVEPSLELRRDISRVIREVRPQRVVCQSPQRNFDRIYASHPDHLAAGEGALAAVYPDSRNRFAHVELLDEGYEPWTVPEIWMMGGPAVNVHVDTSGVIDRKVKALLCHASQIGDPDAMDTLIRTWGAAVAKTVGLPDGSYAEAFQRVDTR